MRLSANSKDTLTDGGKCAVIQPQLHAKILHIATVVARHAFLDGSIWLTLVKLKELERHLMETKMRLLE
jgi:hypothetical protein